MDTPHPAEAPSSAQPDPRHGAEAAPPAAAPGLVVLGDSDAPACTDGVCR